MNETGNREEGTGKSSGNGMDALLSVPASTVESIRAHVNRLHAERGEAVLGAKKSREEQGFKSAAFQLDWKHVEDLTRAIVHYEAELEKTLADHRQEEPAPVKRAAILSLELCDMLDALPKDQFMKATNVLKARLQLSALKASTELITGKAVPA